jgi:hypothetical protein
VERGARGLRVLRAHTDGGAGAVLVLADLDTAPEFRESITNGGMGVGYEEDREEEQRQAPAVPENHCGVVAGGSEVPWKLSRVNTARSPENRGYRHPYCYLYGNLSCHCMHIYSRCRRRLL